MMRLGEAESGQAQRREGKANRANTVFHSKSQKGLRLGENFRQEAAPEERCP